MGILGFITGIYSPHRAKLAKITPATTDNEGNWVTAPLFVPAPVLDDGDGLPAEVCEATGLPEDLDTTEEALDPPDGAGVETAGELPALGAAPPP